mmetsp:Transcript_20246/g.33888  ORF Transcript_20246/g.33888 Transcript_20246/m.33888 type:complete len:357 (+) Transcript_20246:3031-4101(+)
MKDHRSFLAIERDRAFHFLLLTVLIEPEFCQFLISLVRYLIPTFHLFHFFSDHPQATLYSLVLLGGLLLLLAGAVVAILQHCQRVALEARVLLLLLSVALQRGNGALQQAVGVVSTELQRLPIPVGYVLAGGRFRLLAQIVALRRRLAHVLLRFPGCRLLLLQFFLQVCQSILHICLGSQQIVQFIRNGLQSVANALLLLRRLRLLLLRRLQRGLHSFQLRALLFDGTLSLFDQRLQFVDFILQFHHTRLPYLLQLQHAIVECLLLESQLTLLLAAVFDLPLQRCLASTERRDLPIHCELRLLQLHCLLLVPGELLLQRGDLRGGIGGEHVAELVAACDGALVAVAVHNGGHDAPL